MFEKEIAIGAGITVIVIGIVFGTIGMSAEWKATNQIVQNSGNPQLQNSYQTGKEMVDDAGNMKDWSDLSKSVQNSGG